MDNVKKIIAEEVARLMEQPPASAPVPAISTAPAPVNPIQSKPKSKIVRFDKGTPNEFQIKLSERGFSIDGTRLSFEIIETALSKEFTITLKNGQGIALDAVKMQRIMKYKVQ